MSKSLSLVNQPEAESLSELLRLLAGDAFLSDLSSLVYADIAQDLAEPLVYVIHGRSFLLP
jgi:hypothetical protein